MTDDEDAPPAIRISTAEREQAATALGEHFAAGRLDQEEFDERVGLAYAAKTVDDVRPLFDDLPEPRPALLGLTAAPAVAPPPWAHPQRYGPPGRPGRGMGPVHWHAGPGPRWNPRTIVDRSPLPAPVTWTLLAVIGGAVAAGVFFFVFAFMFLPVLIMMMFAGQHMWGGSRY